MLGTVAVIMLVTTTASAQDPSNCQEYEVRLQSRPDMTHRVVTAKSTLPPEYAITDVNLDTSKELSFYWCEMTVDDVHGQRKTLRRFGHNATYWWVTKGCGGWFRIKGCRGARASAAQSIVDPMETPTIVIPMPAAGQPEKSTLQFDDLNSEALTSLITWLSEEGSQGPFGKRPSSLEMEQGTKDFKDKLVVINRNVRSVSEEFVIEFGQKD